MGIIDTAKDVATLVQKLDNIELNKKILELQGQITSQLEENRSLKDQVRDLSGRLEFQGSLEFRRNMYFRRLQDGTEDGPLCSSCWDVERKAVRLQTLGSGAKFCPSCKRSAPGTGDGSDQRPPIPSNHLLLHCRVAGSTARRRERRRVFSAVRW
jgi:hypothetical protein